MSDKKILPLNPHSDDDLPLPERLARMYRFKLAYHDKNDDRYYCVQDWILGIVPKSNVQVIWKLLRNRHSQLYELCIQFPFVTHSGNTVQMDFANAETLYLITQRMEANSGHRDAILLFLAKAGVKLDELMRDPDKAEAMFAELADDKEYLRLLKEGYGHEDAKQWVQVRREQKQEWRRLTDEWKSRGIENRFEYQRLTNDVQVIATGKSATHMKRTMGLKSTSRDYLSASENVAITITGTTSRILHQQRDSQGVDELCEDIRDVRPIVDAARPEIEKVFSKQRRRLPSNDPKNTA